MARRKEQWISSRLIREKDISIEHFPFSSFGKTQTKSSFKNGVRKKCSSLFFGPIRVAVIRSPANHCPTPQSGGSSKNWVLYARCTNAVLLSTVRETPKEEGQNMNMTLS